MGIFRFNRYFAPLFIIILISGCKSTYQSSGFEEVLYPEGRGFTIRQIDEFNNRRFDFYFLEASRLKMLGDYGNAALYFTEAIKLDSTCATCFYEVGNLLIQNGEFKQAEDFIFKSVQIDPTNDHFLFLLTKLYSHNDKIDLALKAVDFLNKQFPDNIEYLYQAAMINSNLENYNQAIAHLNNIEKIIGINEQLSIEKHNIFLTGGNKKNAERELVRLIDHYPGNSMYKLYLGDFFMQIGQPKKAYETYQDVINEDSANGNVYFSLANYYLFNNDTTNFKTSLYKGYSSTNVDLESKVQRLLPFLMRLENIDNPISHKDFNSYFKVLTSLHPHEYQIFLIYGNYLQHIGNDSLALKAFETALLIDERQEELWHEYLLLVFAQYEKPEILPVILRAIELYPNNSFFQYLSGFAYLLNEQPDNALKHMALVPDLSGDNQQLKAQAYGLMGDLYYQTGDPESSFKAYQNSLELNENNVVVLNNYAYYLSVEEKDLQKAEQMISRVIQLEPANPTYLDTYAWVLFKMGKYFDALFIIEQAISAENGSSNGVILEHYGDILYMNGDVEKALVYWQKASETEDEVTKVLPKKIEERRYISDKE